MQRLLIATAVVLTLPGLYLEVSGLRLTPPVAAVLFGLAIFGAAFLLAWAAEVAQMEISKALAVAVLALIAVLPEYAIDLYFAWTAADRPEYGSYATANMTGANRLLVGLGWPLIVLLFLVRYRRKSVVLEPSHSSEIAYLGLATLYAFLIPIKGSLSLLDTVVLLALFTGYMVRSARAEVHEPVLVGPAAYLGQLPRGERRLATLGLFLFSGLVILFVAEPFAESLVASGEALNVDEFLLVQWVAPIASEAPEFIIASLWTLRGDAQAGLGALVSSKVNQWTLLIGTIPLVYSINLGRVGALPLDLRQEHEIWLTSAQSLLAVAVLTNLDLDIGEAVLLFVLFATQFIFPDIRVEISFAYAALAVLLLVLHRGDLPGLYRKGLRGG